MIEDLLSLLQDPMDREVIILYYGLGGRAPMTDKQIGAVVGRARVSVTHRRRKALDLMSSGVYSSPPEPCPSPEDARLLPFHIDHDWTPCSSCGTWAPSGSFPARGNGRPRRECHRCDADRKQENYYRRPDLAKKYKKASRVRNRRDRAKPSGTLSRFDVYDRDKGLCHVCGEVTVNPHEVPWVHKAGPLGVNRLQPVVEHVVALADGGTWDEDNLRCAHSWCNFRKERQAKRDRRLSEG